MKLIGLSLSFCIRDLVEKQGQKVRVVTDFNWITTECRDPLFEEVTLDLMDIESIWSSTKAQNIDVWKEGVLKRYTETLWNKNPQSCCLLAHGLYLIGKIRQMPLEGKWPFQGYGYWTTLELAPSFLGAYPYEV